MKKAKALTAVVEVDKNKCVNCHSCIAACPVKYCNNGAGEVVVINHDLCIGCGSCIAVCTHHARISADDSSRFFKALDDKEKMIAIVAPAVASNFPGQYLNLNGYLKSRGGVEAVFDVSFGAELTVLSYLNYMQEKHPAFCISQPCPAIVTYIQIYRPELIPYLVPADSPMLHTVKMIREYYPQYRHHKVAVISPCIAKRREFDETGLGDFNVTFSALYDYLEKRGINLASFKAEGFDNPQAERAVTFSMPGGLLITAERGDPGIGRVTRKIDGVHSIYPYLADIAKMIRSGGNKDDLPMLVDCLNCEKGCNGGTGTRNGKTPLYALEAPVLKRRAEAEAKYGGSTSVKNNHKKVMKVISSYWKHGLYARAYEDLSMNYTVRMPDERQLKEAYKTLRKYSEKDMYDCNTCGYGSCYGMAVAIFNGLNRPENCHHYDLALIKEDHETIDTLNKNLHIQVEQSLAFMKDINTLIDALNAQILHQTTAVKDSSAAIEQMTATIADTAGMAQKKQSSIKKLANDIEEGRASMQRTIEAVGRISTSVEGVGSTIKVISGIAANTNLLSMNAAIEAAHAGDAGMGFAVVAGEIRRLSDTTAKNSRDIAHTLKAVIEGIRDMTARSSATDGLIAAIADEMNGFANAMTELIRSLGELSEGSKAITSALVCLRKRSEDIKSKYHTMMDKTRTLEASMQEITRMKDNARS
ncbi:MAG: methyl-accepting chemotaxis protein [Treponema sp.]|jgi:iron only hydrogenase large subunit-like protein/uncharacterized protein YoxC|nr:methyl-accepting chemotaxis protein [Treponema sp.]